MKQKISLEELPNLVVDLASKVDKLQEQISKLQNNEEATPVWFDINTLCNYLPQKPAKQTVYEWCANRKIPYHKSGGIKGKHTLFLKREIDEWLMNANIKSEEIIEDEVNIYLKNEDKRYHK